MIVFDHFVKEYDEWYERPFGRSAYLLELRCLKDLLGKFKLGLEVGVGTGRFASSLGVRVGVDPSLEMLKVAERRGVHAVQGEGESLPFKNSSFDLVLIVVSICFVKDPLRVLRECRRFRLYEGYLRISPKNSTAIELGSSFEGVREAAGQLLSFSDPHHPERTIMRSPSAFSFIDENYTCTLAGEGV